ncbi:MAG TPA: hypothetical protein VF612_14320 [Jatrophihabitans sp.]|jgi:hypothetical protein|uniref:hypothetical protein n=1 Tax=Jatrophihabitans sp. TaxID=1932789 RepID=UPI002EE166D3
MPEPLVCEDSNLQRLLDTVQGQPGAEILYQDRVRRGGVFGFFAREVHRVAYRVPTEGEDAGTGASGPLDADPVAAMPAAPVAAGPVSTAPADDPRRLDDFSRLDDLPRLDDLLASVEAAESAGQHAAPASSAEPPRHDFAELLRTLTEDEPAEATPVVTEQVSPRPAPVASGREPASRTNVTAFGRPDARARLEMLMQLRQVGVPVSVNPRADTHSLYEALENILDELPAPAAPPRGAGQVLAVVGESGPALQAAHTCAAMLRIPRNSIGIAGLPEHSSEGGDHRDYPVITGQQEALRLRTELRRAELPAIVVIATDATEAGSDDPWAAEMLAALRPAAIWAVVDARWKTEDSRAQLDRLGRVDALVVHSAQLSASPASVWDLDLPLGLLDGRAASTFAWTGLLFPLLRSGARHRASA